MAACARFFNTFAWSSSASLFSHTQLAGAFHSCSRSFAKRQLSRASLWLPFCHSSKPSFLNLAPAFMASVNFVNDGSSILPRSFNFSFFLLSSSFKYSELRVVYSSSIHSAALSPPVSISFRRCFIRSQCSGCSRTCWNGKSFSCDSMFRFARNVSTTLYFKTGVTSLLISIGQSSRCSAYSCLWQLSSSTFIFCIFHVCFRNL
mmetsp:Transcript_41695/g.73222  ORF Transcript_41695/g.73222 Transcript_41695/m.73222 type:complete len:204 (-) Transcript_41695:439-1050(-)